MLYYVGIIVLFIEEKILKEQVGHEEKYILYFSWSWSSEKIGAKKKKNIGRTSPIKSSYSISLDNKIVDCFEQLWFSFLDLC